MRKLFRLMLALATGASQGESIDAVDPLIGTDTVRGEDIGNSAGMVPAVCVPFGGVKWVPMTRLTEIGSVSYFSKDPAFLGFIGTRQPSPWMGDFGQVSVMARVGKVECDYATRGVDFDRAACTFAPDYCRIVDASGVVSEVTASSHAAILRFTFPAGVPHHLVLDASRTFTARLSDKRPFPGGLVFGADRRSVSLWNTDRPDAHFGPPLKNWRTETQVTFSAPFVRTGTYADGVTREGAVEVEGDQCGGWVEFDPEVTTVEVRIATSAVRDPAGVAARELGTLSFAALRAETAAAWERKLNVITFDADDETRRVFTTAVYHACQFPAEFSEGGRYYSAFDDTIHTGEAYTSFSLWDTYRAEHPFLTLVAPERVDGFVRSLLQMYQEGGYLPKWPNPSYTGIMVGSPAEIVIAEAWQKGFRGFDLNLAYEAVKHNATVPTPNDDVTNWSQRIRWTGHPETRGGLTTYQTLGYVASDKTHESVSRTQDFGHDDLGAAVLADAVGRPEEAAYFRARSKNYTNLWNAAKGTFWPRQADGTWQATATAELSHPDYTEQSAKTAVWGVPYDVPGLARLVGGEDELERRLDAYFGNYFYGVDGRTFSHHDNEPTHHVAYLYAAIGRYDKCAREVRRILTTCYSSEPWGMEGNDDCGQMSAWYVLSALGFYPLDPTSGEYVIGSPLVRSAKLRIGAPYAPAEFKIVAHNQSRENARVVSVKLNGQELANRRLKHADIVRGGVLEFEMSK